MHPCNLSRCVQSIAWLNILHVLSLCRRWQADGSLRCLPKPGKARATTPRTDRRILRAARQNPFFASLRIKQHLRLRIHHRTVQRRLVEGGLMGRIAARTEKLTVLHRQLRLQFATVSSIPVFQLTVDLYRENSILFLAHNAFSITLHHNGVSTMNNLDIWKLPVSQYQLRETKRTGHMAMLSEMLYLMWPLNWLCFT